MSGGLAILANTNNFIFNIGRFLKLMEMMPGRGGGGGIIGGTASDCLHWSETK